MYYMRDNCHVPRPASPQAEINYSHLFPSGHAAKAAACGFCTRTKPTEGIKLVVALYSLEKNLKYVLKLAQNVLGKKCPRQHFDIDKFRAVSLRIGIAYDPV